MTIHIFFKRLAQIAVIWFLSLSMRNAFASDRPTAEAATTESLIAKLAEIAGADYGLSESVSGSDFPPVAGQGRSAMMLLSSPVQQRRHPALVELVARGPQALPDLLKHLDDKTPTKLSVEHDGRMGGMWYATEVLAPEGAVEEAAIIEKAGIKIERHLGGIDITKHQVTVGDVCFAIIGMITHRPYNAVRYQPTACIVVNSPTSSPVIATAVRALWPGQDHAEPLYQRLMADSARDDPTAATRLLFYFRARARDAVVSRVRKAIEGKEPSEAEWIGAVAFCDDRELREMVQTAVLADRTGEKTRRGASSLQGLPLDTQLKHLLRWKGGHDWNEMEAGQACLRTAFHSYPESSGRIIQAFLDSKPAETMNRAALAVFYALESPPVKELARLLKDKGKGYGQYLQDGPLDEKASKRWVDYRVCDNTYEIICRALGDTKAKCIGDYKEMDRKVLGLVTRLEQAAARWPFTPAEIEKRQAAQTQPQEARKQLISQIGSDGTNPEERWLLTLQNDRMTESDWQEAGEMLLSPESDSQPADARNLLANWHLNRTTRLEKLSSEHRRRFSAALAGRLQSIMDELKEKTFPDNRCSIFCALLAMSPDSPEKTSALQRLLGLERSAFSTHDWPPEDDLDSMILTMQGLLLANVEGAPDFYLALAQKATPEKLKRGMGQEHFFQLMADHPMQQEMLKAASWCFERKESPWHLSKASYAMADNLGNANLLRVQPFRSALAKALSDQRDAGTLSIEKDKPDDCSIKWKSGGSSGQGVDAATAGLKPGGTMEVRHCDALLEGVANGVFNEVKGAEFHIYWPEARRNEAIEKWVQLLQQPHH